MLEPRFVILYVDNPVVSADFYASIFGFPPAETSPTFAMFTLASGFRFGLWSKHTVEPTAKTIGYGGELAFPVADIEAVRGLYTDWNSRDMVILQTPTAMDFGFTFVACDPDGHRLRVFAPGAP